MDRREINRVAQYLVDQRGEEAAPHAKQNLDWADASNDVNGARDWTRILRTIKGLRDGRDGDEAGNVRI